MSSFLFKPFTSPGQPLLDKKNEKDECSDCKFRILRRGSFGGGGHIVRIDITVPYTWMSLLQRALLSQKKCKDKEKCWLQLISIILHWRFNCCNKLFIIHYWKTIDHLNSFFLFTGHAWIYVYINICAILTHLLIRTFNYLIRDKKPPSHLDQ